MVIVDRNGDAGDVDGASNVANKSLTMPADARSVIAGEVVVRRSRRHSPNRKVGSECVA